MERYNITITDNETGKEMQNIDTNGFIMAVCRKIDGGENAVQTSSAFDEISPTTLANMIWQLSNLTKEFIEAHRELKPLLGLIQILAKED